MRPTFLPLLAVLLLGIVATPAAQAHARMVRSNPARDAEIAGAPPQIDLWFNELLEAGFHFVSIFPASELSSRNRSNHAKDKPVLDPHDRAHLSVQVTALPPGEYVVEWRVLSRDAHTAQGRFTFRVR